MARILAALALLVSVIGCSDDSEANEARLLLDRLENVQTPDLRQWRRKVDALGAMPLEAERTVDVRDKCHAMHDALLRAEEATEEARRGMDELEADEGGDAATVAAALARSEEAIAETRELRGPCEDARAELEARYGSRRPSP